MPAIMYAATESGNAREKPNTIVATPYTATAASSARPAFTVVGRSIITSADESAPISSDDESNP